jgi:cation diffusion facilitator CzcD-associated flavoprotein CzcO
MVEMTPSAAGPAMSTSAHPMKKVAVLGAGLSGLVTIKELLEESHSVVCFEQEADLGGAFGRNKRSDHGAYNDMHLTVSNYFMSFSSFPPRDAKRRYWTATEYANYLEDFAGHFQLRDYIRVNSTVLAIEPVDNETWRIRYQQDGKVLEEYVDAVAIRAAGAVRTRGSARRCPAGASRRQVQHSLCS